MGITADMTRHSTLPFTSELINQSARKAPLTNVNNTRTLNQTLLVLTSILGTKHSDKTTIASIAHPAIFYCNILLAAGDFVGTREEKEAEFLAYLVFCHCAKNNQLRLTQI